jgi:hypothetical protein
MRELVFSCQQRLSPQHFLDCEQTMTSTVIDQVNQWLQKNKILLTQAGIEVSTEPSAPDRDPASLVVDLGSPTRSARLVIWANGQAQLNSGRQLERVVTLDEYVPDVTRLGVVELFAHLMADFE